MSEWSDAVAKLTKEDWSAIEGFNSRLQSHTGSWGKTEGGDELEPGVIQMPYVTQDPLVSEFVQLWYEKDLVIPFDWSAWTEGREWYASTDDSKYDSLDFEMSLKLLTAIIRNDRFNEGALVNAFETGVFPKIINKLVGLRTSRQ